MCVDLSVCIVNRNARDLLLACLESVFAQSRGLQLQVIVVDNGSTDDSADYVRRQYPSVQIVENDANTGFVHATNQALRTSQGRYVLWLNNDTLVLDCALTRLVHFMDARPEIGICGPKVLNRDGTLQNQCRRGFPTPWAALTYFTGLSRLFPADPRFSRYLLTYLDPDQPQEVDAVSGACLLARRAVVDAIGLIDTRYHSYGEDLDYCAEAKKRDWKVYYVSDARIVHYGGQGGSGVRPYTSVYQFYRSMWLFYQKQIGPQHFPIINWTIGTAIWAKCGLSLSLNLLRKRKVVGSSKP